MSCLQMCPSSWGLGVRLLALCPHCTPLPASPTSGASLRSYPPGPRAPFLRKGILCRGPNKPARECSNKMVNETQGIFRASSTGICTERLRIKGNCKAAGEVQCLLQSHPEARWEDRSAFSLKVTPPPPSLPAAPPGPTYHPQGPCDT